MPKMIPGSHLAQVTHFAEDVELPDDAVTLYYATLPANEPGAVMDEMIAVAIQVPLESRRLALSGEPGQRSGER